MGLLVMMHERELTGTDAERILENKPHGFLLATEAAFRTDVIALRNAGAFGNQARNLFDLQGATNDAANQDCAAEAEHGNFLTAAVRCCRDKRKCDIEAECDQEIGPGAAREAQENAKRQESCKCQRRQRALQRSLKSGMDGVEKGWNQERSKHVRVLECARCAAKFCEDFRARHNVEVADQAGCGSDCGGDGHAVQDQLGVGLRFKCNEACEDEGREVEIQ